MSVKAVVACILGLWYTHSCNTMTMMHNRASSSVSEIKPYYTLDIEEEVVKSLQQKAVQQETIRRFSAHSMLTRIAAGSFDDLLEVLFAQLALASYCNQRIPGECVDTSKDDEVPPTMLISYLCSHAHAFVWQRYLIKNMRSCHTAIAAALEPPYYQSDDLAEVVKSTYLKAKNTFETLKKDRAKAMFLYYCLFISPIKQSDEQRALAKTMQKNSAQSFEEINIYFKAFETLYVQYSCCDISHPHLKIYLDEFKEAVQSIELYTQGPTSTQIFWDQFFCKEMHVLDELPYPCPEPLADAKLLHETWKTCIALGEFLQDLGFYPCDISQVTQPTKNDIQSTLVINAQLFATLFENGLLSFSLKQATTSLWNLMRKLYAPSAQIPPVSFIIPQNDLDHRVTFCPVPQDHWYVLPEAAKNAPRPSPHSLIVDSPFESQRVTPHSSYGSSYDLPGMISTTAECTPPSKTASPSIIFEQSL